MAEAKKKKDAEKKGSLGNLEGKVHKLTVEEQSEGGKVSVESRRRSKTMKEMLKAMMSTPNAKAEVAELMKAYGLDGDENEYCFRVILALLDEAKKGNVRASETLARWMGEEEPQDINLNVSGSSVQFYLPEKEKD